MLKFRILATGLALATATVVFADGHAENPAVSARNAHMSLYAFNLGLLGDMAKGNVDYDAEAASAAASNLAALSQLSQARYWPPGTAQGEVPGSRAKAEIWTDSSGAIKLGGDFRAAAAKLAENAGGGLEALQAGVGEVGAACGACHKAYRGPKN